MKQSTTTAPKVGGAYAHYVLIILVLVYVLNFVDRSILSILAEDIKADLGISDAQLGFLYGTVFALFYAVFGIPLARFADAWTRRSLVAIGLAVWSLMTAASGLARSFGVLAGCRIGVGIGEASASPAAYSLLADYYPPERRATVIAIYAAGIYIGMGIGLFLGGYILDAWATAYPDPSQAPFGFKGWQVAFMVVGLPGVLMAIWVRTLREPPRGISEGLVTEPHPAPFRLLGHELVSILPPFNLIELIPNRKSLQINLVVAAIIALGAWGLIQLTGSIAQWVATAIGFYITFSWAQSLKLRDPVAFAMIFRSKAFVYMALAFSLTSFVGYGAGFWVAPFLFRVHEVSATEVGLYLGLANAFGGFIGVTLGGVLADYLKQKFPSGRLVLGYFAIFGVTPFLLLLLHAESLTAVYIFNFFIWMASSCFGGVPPATASDLVMPRMRAVAGALILLLMTFLGLALGPYVIGQVSDMFQAGGMNEADALRRAISLSTLVFIPSFCCLVMAQKHLPRDEANRLERARELGEPVEAQ